MNNGFSRREFIQTLMAGVLLGPVVLKSQAASMSAIPTRALGKTGERVSIVGFGGWDLGFIDEKLAVRMMHEGIDEGITFIDNAWEYNQGRSEEVVGKGLKEGKLRDKVFLMTKVCARDYEGAKRHLDDALRRMNTEMIDMVQLHSIQYDGDRERVFDPENGALRALIEGKKDGKLRFIGFTGHRDPKIHLDMLNMPFEWDATQMPLNILDAHYNSFQQKILPVANQRDIAVLGMKSLVGSFDRISTRMQVSAELCRHYALSLPVSSLICGMQNFDEMRMMIEIARDFKPLTGEKISEMLDNAAFAAKTGEAEYYKDSNHGYGCSYHTKVLKEEQG
ncbi:MAG: oxidoreductase of aldo/keto reductase [Prolixibacteraceae bacterium]|nr:MAG: oxidoreductase of aldo/keto reductase [Prolixibacteraceae bacterium]